MNIDKINAVLVRAIVGLQESEIEAMSEAAYKPPSPAQLAKKAKPKKKSKSRMGVDSKCMKSHRNAKGDFDSFADCVAAFGECSAAKDPEGVCASLMIHRKQAKSKFLQMGGKKKKKEDEEE